MRSPSEELRQLQTDGLLRGLKPLDSPTGPQVTRDGRTLWNFASNDYLGLARHPQIEAALIEGWAHLMPISVFTCTRPSFRLSIVSGPALLCGGKAD